MMIHLKSSANFELNRKEVIQYNQNNKAIFLQKSCKMAKIKFFEKTFCKKSHTGEGGAHIKILITKIMTDVQFLRYRA